MQMPVIPSDALAISRQHLVNLPALHGLIDLPLQLWLVIDTNAVIADLIWLSSTRINPCARTILQEIIDSGTVVVCAPLWLWEEVAERLPEIARKQHIPEAHLRQTWQDYQRYLHPCSDTAIRTRMNQPMVGDPDDLPYIWLCDHIHAQAIISYDLDIVVMGGTIIERHTLAHLRDYARTASPLVASALAGYAITMLGTGSTILMVHVAVAFVRHVWQLPWWSQLALLVGMGIVLRHPHGRRTLETMWRQLTHDGAAITTRLLDVLATCLHTWMTKQHELSHISHVLEQSLPPASPLPLEAVAYAVCFVAGTPLSLPDITTRVRLHGYQSRARDFKPYLRRVLRRSPRFIQHPDGRWSAVA